MAPSSTRETYKNVVHEAEVDGGWSGQLRIVLGKGISDEELVFVDSDLLGPRRLVLTPQQTIEVATRLAAAAAEVVPPDTWDLEAFQSTFGLRLRWGGRGRQQQDRESRPPITCYRGNT